MKAKPCTFYDKLSGTTIKNMPFEERIGQLMKSPLGFEVVIFITFTINLCINLQWVD